GDNRSLLALSLDLVIAAVVLLPATVAMGATTPALIEAWRRRRTDNTNTVAWLYAVNTFGATIGIALTIYALLPIVGVRAGAAILGGFSIAGAVLAGVWQRAPRFGIADPATDAKPSATGLSRLAPCTLLFFTGLAGIGLETIGTQVLAQIFDNTIH